MTKMQKLECLLEEDVRYLILAGLISADNNNSTEETIKNIEILKECAEIFEAKGLHGEKVRCQQGIAILAKEIEETEK